jgi:TolB-like protein/class 3 adenylate cyclase/Tfp pilus assembly protein PilF
VTERARRLAAVWFADIAGYTDLSARDEDTAVRLVELLQAIAREVVDKHGGRVVKFIGDAVLAEFQSTDGAVRSALDVRDRFAGACRSAGLGGNDLRIGAHVGEIVTSADGDVYGDGVNAASRLQGSAEPGEVWVSEDMWRQLRQRPEFGFEPRGEHALKGLASPIELYSVRLKAGVSPGPSGAHAAVVAKVSGRAAPARSIAVLPFANMSRDPENEYFSDGVTEEILATLARIEGLKVISRTSIMQYKGVVKPMRQIGEELGVATVLEGSVRQAGQRVRITAQLIDAATDEHVWVETYDRTLDDVFAIQTDVAERIVEALRVRLSPREKARIAERPTESVEAYQWYLKGRYFLPKRTEEALQQAIEHFRQAVEADPSFAQAWVGMADGYALLTSYSEAPVAESCAEARAAAERALALDPGLGEAHATLGFAAQALWDMDDADREYGRAIQLSPGYATAHHWYGFFLTLQGRHDEAIAELLRALELDPVSLPVLNALGAAYRFAGRFDEAIRTFRKLLQMDPGYVFGHTNLAETYDILDRFEEALEEWEASSRISQKWMSPDVLAELRAGYETGGARGYWEAWLAALGSREGFLHGPFYLAIACAKLGRLDEAFEWLDRIVAERNPIAVQISGYPAFESLRSDPRYEELLRRINPA